MPIASQRSGLIFELEKYTSTIVLTLSNVMQNQYIHKHGRHTLSIGDGPRGEINKEDFKPDSGRTANL